MGGARHRAPRSRARGLGLRPARVPGGERGAAGRGLGLPAPRCYVATDQLGLCLVLLLQIVPELPSPGRVAELGERLRLDLADPLAGDAELPPDLLERPGLPV